LCAFISSSFTISSFLDDLPLELRWQAVLDEVSIDDENDDDEEEEDDGGDGMTRRSGTTAGRALQSLNHLVSSAKDDVERRIAGVMTRTVDALGVCVRRQTAIVTSPCCVSTPWHDVSSFSALAQ